MAKAGDVIENPISGERITFLKTTTETSGELLRFEYVLPPRFSIPEHFHPRQEERHEVLSGTLRGHVGGQERDYGEGERVIGPAGVPHAWRNPSTDEELRLVSEIRPPLVFETILETYFGLARDGKSTKQGIPKNPLQIAVMADESRGMFYSSRVPVAVQEGFLTLLALLASIGRLLGYKARYPEYSGPEEQPKREDRLSATVSEAMKGQSDGDSATSRRLSARSMVCVLWLLNSAIGARVAIRENLPGEFAGMTRWQDPSADFFRGGGTALSPGLPMMAAQAVFTVLSTHGGRAGKVGAAGLVALGAGSTLGVVGEPITYRVLSPRAFDPAKAPIVSAAIVLSALMSVLSARRPRALRSGDA